MLANDHPGCWGVAARLPKKPGIQKLTPLSSASAIFGAHAAAANASTAAVGRMNDSRLRRDFPRSLQSLGFIIVPLAGRSDIRRAESESIPRLGRDYANRDNIRIGDRIRLIVTVRSHPRVQRSRDKPGHGNRASAIYRTITLA